jgi:hypothetical protein
MLCCVLCCRPRCRSPLALCSRTSRSASSSGDASRMRVNACLRAAAGATARTMPPLLLHPAVPKDDTEFGTPMYAVHGFWDTTPTTVRSGVIECDVVPDHFVPIGQTCENLNPLWNLRNFEHFCSGSMESARTRKEKKSSGDAGRCTAGGMMGRRRLWGQRRHAQGAPAGIGHSRSYVDVDAQVRVSRAQMPWFSRRAA